MKIYFSRLINPLLKYHEIFSLESELEYIYPVQSLFLLV